jgi:site-specific DNA-methyltransferase (adenine-specific)
VTYGFGFADVMLADPPPESPPAWWTSDDWETPWPLVHALEARFGVFTLDPCCRSETAKAPSFFTKEDDGLTAGWVGRVFMNPPYSDIAPWVRKAHCEVTVGGADLVAALIPAATDTRWFQQWVAHKSHVLYIAGRVRFIGWKGTAITNPRTPNVVALYVRGVEG